MESGEKIWACLVVIFFSHTKKTPIVIRNNKKGFRIFETQKVPYYSHNIETPPTLPSL